MTCEYCRYPTVDPSNKVLPGHDDSEHGEELYARIHGGCVTRPRIIVFQEGTKNALFIDINYCPICGRGLREVVDE